MPQVKSVDALMKYLRSHHGIAVGGSIGKRKLRNIGYYHGYKGYRFIRTASNRVVFTDFQEVVAINELDLRLKSLFYSRLMFIETALKNYVLEIFMKHTKTHNFNTIYDQLLTDYRRHTVGSKEYRREFQKRLQVRDRIFSALTRDYRGGRTIVQHFYHKNEPIPIWAIFEVVSLGDFGSLVACCNTSVKLDIGKTLQINVAFNSDGRIAETIIFLLRDLRNAVAHNNVVFDTRFNRRRPPGALTGCLGHETGVRNISFGVIVDYLVLITYVLKHLKVPKSELRALLREFQTIQNDFYRQLPTTVYSQVFHTDTRSKIAQLHSFITT